MDKRISVIIPVYNSGKYLEKCINSIKSQSVMPYEVILVDDGSDDDSLQMCLHSERTLSYVKVVHMSHKGLVAARKEGTSSAVGDYIMFVDSDDWIENDSIERLQVIIRKYEPDVIASSFVEEHKGINSIRKEFLKEGYYDRKEIEKALDDIVRDVPFFSKVMGSSLCTKIINKELLKKIQKNVDSSISYGEGDAISFPLMLEMKNLYVVEKPYYHYVVRKDSMSWKKSEDRYKEITLWCLENGVKIIKSSYC